MSVRVLHQFAAAEGIDNVAAYLTTARAAAGCVEAEYYRSLEDPARIALTELWADLDAYSAHWRRVLEAGVVLPGLSGFDDRGEAQGSEFYLRSEYEREAEVWVPTARPSEPWRVQFPARGRVRVLVATSSRPTPEDPWPGGRAALEETRREPGCVQFEVFAGVEFPQDALLLELWQDQIRYDTHWRLRTRTRESGAVPRGGGGASEPRGHGSNTVEFYRHERFRHLYDRWLPASEDAWSDVVVWTG